MKGTYAVATSYKETMNLPKTDFPMRGNLPENEPKRLQKWNDLGIYWRVLEKNKQGQPFILHDGPPYANGPIHIGHSFNKILKDFVVKSHAQRGFYTPYVPGWDCHGQPIEHMVEVKLGPEKMAKIDQPTLRRICREWAEKYIDVQRDGFKRLGVNADWEHPYLTFTPGYEAGNAELFKELYLKGAIYRGRKPIHWCKHCHTALAEAEIEYSDETSSSIFVKFELDEVPAGFVEAGIDTASILIWTTTPWTLPANVAVSLAPEADYCMVHVDGANMIMAYDLVEQVAEIAGWEAYEIVKVDEKIPASAGNPFVLMKGKELKGITYTCPIRQDLKGTIIYGDHVTLDTGTGAVHTAPGHGQDDYLVALEFDLPTLMPVDDNGVFTEEAGGFAGLDINAANPLIVEWLKEQGTLVAAQKITHSYPHCWRCHEPVIFRATDQWFVSMDATGLREAALKVIKDDVEWIPAWASNRIGSMVEERPDWCISRQRSWGVPIPVFKCAKCGNTIATEETFDAVIELFKTEGADTWFTKKPSEYLPTGVACETCGCEEVVAEKDILDVWWESGVSHTSVLKYRESEGLHFPADMYLEGSDQHRGWFQSSLLTSVGAYGVAPYKSVMHCGFTMDAEGKKMSKSAGNGIDPADVMKKFGADVLRLWVASVDYSQDVNISDEILQRTSEAYRRIRNTFRYLLSNLEDFDYRKHVVSVWEDMPPLDQWAMARVQSLLKDVETAYDSYKYHQVFRLVYDYVVGDLSAVYMDAAKDRLYSEAQDSLLRRSAQTTLMNILEVLVRVLAPILSFTTDEVWEHYPEGLRSDGGHAESVQLAGWPEDKDFLPNLEAARSKTILDDFTTILEVRESVMRELEEARNAKTISKSQEAQIKVELPKNMHDVVMKYASEVYEELFIVSAVAFEVGDGLTTTVSPAAGQKCPRCWNYRMLGENSAHPEVCGRCADALGQ